MAASLPAAACLASRFLNVASSATTLPQRRCATWLEPLCVFELFLEVDAGEQALAGDAGVGALDEEIAAGLGDEALQLLATEARRRRDAVDGVDALDGLPQGPALGEGRLREAVEAGVADAARGRVDDATQRDLVGAVQGELHVREQIFDLLALEELLAADDLVVDLLGAERLFEGLRLPVRAVQDRDLAWAYFLVFDETADAVRDPRGFAVGRGAGEHDGFVAADLRREERFFVADGLLRDDRVGDVEHGRDRPVVLFEEDDLGAGKLALELEDVFHVGAAPRIDGLVVVADDAQVLVVSGEQAQQLELRGVRVLILVDEEKPTTRARFFQEVGGGRARGARSRTRGRRSRTRRSCAAPFRSGGTSARRWRRTRRRCRQRARRLAWPARSSCARCARPPGTRRTSVPPFRRRGALSRGRAGHPGRRW